MTKTYEVIDVNLPHKEWVEKFARMYDIHSLAIRLEEIEYQGRDLKSPRETIFDQKAAKLSQKLG